MNKTSADRRNKLRVSGALRSDLDVVGVLPHDLRGVFLGIELTLVESDRAELIVHAVTIESGRTNYRRQQFRLNSRATVAEPYAADCTAIRALRWRDALLVVVPPWGRLLLDLDLLSEVDDPALASGEFVPTAKTIDRAGARLHSLSSNAGGRKLVHRVITTDGAASQFREFNLDEPTRVLQLAATDRHLVFTGVRVVEGQPVQGLGTIIHSSVRASTHARWHALELGRTHQLLDVQELKGGVSVWLSDQCSDDKTQFLRQIISSDCEARRASSFEGAVRGPFAIERDVDIGPVRAWGVGSWLISAQRCTALARVDMRSERVSLREERFGCWVAAPQLAASTDAAGTRRWLLALVNDVISESAHLVVLNADSLGKSPIGRIRLPTSKLDVQASFWL